MKIKQHIIFLGLGSNVGDKKKNLEKAVSKLKEEISDIKISKFYETEPWGYTQQDRFLNAAICGKTFLTSLELLRFVKLIEKKIGRIKRFKWGPREIDIDILFYDDLIYKDSSVEIPHPNLWERKFVLEPLMDLDPNFIHPIFKKTVRQLYEKLSITTSL